MHGDGMLYSHRMVFTLSHLVISWSSQMAPLIRRTLLFGIPPEASTASTSRDFRTWSSPEWLIFHDTPEHHLYTNQMAPYARAPHIFFGFPIRYTDRGWINSTGKLPHPNLRRLRADINPRYGSASTDGLMMTSRDGRIFKRWEEALLRPGPSRTNSWVYGRHRISPRPRTSCPYMP